MAFNGSGVFERLYSWVTDRDAGTKIIADRVDAETDGIVAGINSVVDGTQGFIAPVRGSNGTAALPGHSFTDDTNTGMYRVSADVLGFSVAGTLEGQFEAGYFDAVNGLKLGGVAVSSTAAELNILDGATITTGGINLLGDFVGTFTLPVSDGTDGQVLTTDGAGGLLFEDAAGGGVDVQEFTASGTWTKPASGTYAKIEVWGAGAGGGSGRQGSGASQDAFGGTGGGGGAYIEITIPLADLSATATVVVGAGGTGGAAQATSNTDGSNGADGGVSYFIDSGVAYALANGGKKGLSGSTAAKDGGDGGDSGQSPPEISGQDDQITHGGLGNSTGGSSPGGKSYFGGGAGGGMTATGTSGGGNSSIKGGAGGGAGGGHDGAVNQNSQGGAVGFSNRGAGTQPFTDGGAGGNASADGSSGGGGNYGGGTGGAGAAPAGGGGGGGGHDDGTSGAGGDGADGFVRVTVY
ncbi:hypothetical protein JQV19_08380 [Sulfitobacter mediterraneus]|uniref:glycine-rich domain-containing protein n=1 Tax=Sulfitobacter mediterraneus TaxID=83219 RepID=UPI00193A8EDF|nr:hypothetical protein [Sulfitobacter mediterraneus]MBM1556662.1 hypothetical protein [Sulfitobacter mediterraneus]MBM1570142.1 hypothetical protein [Sulfitobacter mediterraneus]MBM1574098.1 hypothetical protein [Sulfitobacter mediterraneus]MBM1577884.1 hypothetical protein [Sulfitobacter mediterraneus]MBM1579620.1 hypothetical protein [Sulfitobacter mediterraneus]